MPGRMHREQQQPGSLATRLLWFAALWLAGVASVALAALLIRAVLL
jgi:hypothetical protein